MEKNKNSYLFIWNPQKWNWVDLPEAIYKINTNELYDICWSCGNTKKINTGDFFFLMRLGVPPKGIIGYGQTLSSPYELPHWDSIKAGQGKNALRVDLLFSYLADTPILEESFLKSSFPKMNWLPQSSGISIPTDISTKILSLLKEQNLELPEKYNSHALAKLSEGKSKIATIKTYSRNPVARQMCINYHGVTCAICGFNFQKKYGDIGKGFIHVHHLNEISNIAEEYEINPINDLRPVCANCHVILHRRRPSYSINEIKKILNS